MDLQLVPGSAAFVAPLAPRAAPAQYAGAQAGAASGSVVSPLSAWGCAAAVAVGASLKRSHRRRAVARAALAEGTSRAQQLEEGSSRRAALLGCAGALALPVAPQGALAYSISEARDVAAKFGTPAVIPDDVEKKLPDGWRLVVEPIGLAKDAQYGRFDLGNEPLVVEFYVPSGWIVNKPNIDFNGSAGTVQANDYGKGDSATLYVDPKWPKKIEDMKRPDFQKALKKSLTQKGAGAIDDVIVTKIEDRQGYKFVKFDWEIYSGAGLLITRSGYAAISQTGEAGALQIFWAGTVSNRVKKASSMLQTMVESFRIQKVPNDIKDKFVVAEGKEKEDDAGRGLI